jgi:hypothetical protein
MKKRIFLVGIGLLLVSVASLSCAPVQKTMITKSNLSILKGTWQEVLGRVKENIGKLTGNDLGEIEGKRVKHSRFRPSNTLISLLI